MTTAGAFDPIEITERFFTVVKSLNEFDKAEVRGVIRTLIAPAERDICFTGNYYRGVANVESLLSVGVFGLATAPPRAGSGHILEERD